MPRDLLLGLHLVGALAHLAGCVLCLLARRDYQRATQRAANPNPGTRAPLRVLEGGLSAQQEVRRG